MPLRIFQSDNPTYDDLHEAVLMAMASSYPQITQGQEARLKATLLALIDAPDRKDRDPAELMRLFREAMDGV
jgi:hypothetical protein